MEAEERPKKMQKLEHEDVAVSGKPESVPANSASMENAGDTNPELPFGDVEQAGAGSTDATATVGNGEALATPALSKNQQKKLKRREQWEATRDWRKEKRKEKILEKKQRQREQKAAFKNGEPTEPWPVSSRKQRHRSKLQPITLVIDCSYDDLMAEKEITSLASQITRLYSDNSKAPFRSHLIVSSFNGTLKDRFNTALAKTHESWKGITFMDEDFVAAAEAAKEEMKAKKAGKVAGVLADRAAAAAAATTAERAQKDEQGASEPEGEIIYLSSDSDETLMELKPYSTYIIGGLVDKNRHKGICHKTAVEKGIKTAKLPIGDFMQMNSRFVLATNHVVEIMLKWLEVGDWGQAFMDVMPKRKGAMLKLEDREGSASTADADQAGDTEDPSPNIADAVEESKGDVEALEALEAVEAAE